MKKLEIPFPKHYLCEEMHNYLCSNSREMLHPFVDGWFYRWLGSDNQGDVLFRCKMEPELNLVRVEVLDSEGQEADLFRVKDFVLEWWDLRRDLLPFYKKVGQDPLLGPLVAQKKGLRIGGIPDLWECTAWSIVGQQVNLSFATTLKNRLIEHFGESRGWKGIKIWRFPSAKAIARLEPTDLKPLSISQRKAEYLIGFAGLLLSGEVSKAKLQGFESAAEASARLKKIRGIGKWSSNYILLRCLRFPDAFPLGDAALYNSVRDLLGMEAKPTDDELLELAQGWKGWEAYATYHLWYGM